MHLRISVAELKILALRAKPLPEALGRVEARADVIHIDLDLRKIPTESLALTLAAKAAGVIRVEAAFAGFDPLTQVASFSLGLQSRSVPAHRLINLFTGHVNKLLNTPGGAGPLPPGVITVEHGHGHPLVTVDLGSALAELTGAEDLSGTFRSFTVADGHVEIDMDWTSKT